MLKGGGSQTDMKQIKLLHTADLHLDSPFEALSPGKAAARRTEQRNLLLKIAALAIKENVDAVLLAGDLLDGENSYYETSAALNRVLGKIPAPVFIAPGNHDYYRDGGPYSEDRLPENVYVFRKSRPEKVQLKEIGLNIYGVGFTDRCCGSLLEGFSAAREEGLYNVMCVHGDIYNQKSKYNYISEEKIASSGMDYIALGHVHTASGLMKAGNTYYSYPGCPEGRGFDETGEKTVSIITLSDSGCGLETFDISNRRYEKLEIDITGADPESTIKMALPDETIRDIYRITLVGETSERIDVSGLEKRLEDLFYSVEIRDGTHPSTDVWTLAGNDSLRGIFLAKLKTRLEQTGDEDEKRMIEQAARWGIAAMDNMEEPARHED